MEFKKEQIKYLADLAKLNIKPTEEIKIHQQLKDILAYLGKLDEIVDLPEVAKFSDPVKTTNIWRDDVVNKISEQTRQEILNSAPARDEDLIKTKPVFKDE